MKFWKICIILIFTIFVQNCDRIRAKRVTDKYYLIRSEMDLKKYYLSYGLPEGDYIGVIEPDIVAIGFDKNYILVKQNDLGTINYFIIRLQIKKFDYFFRQVIGPLNKIEFNNKKKELMLPDTLLLYNIDK